MRYVKQGRLALGWQIRVEHRLVIHETLAEVLYRKSKASRSKFPPLLRNAYPDILHVMSDDIYCASCSMNFRHSLSPEKASLELLSSACLNSIIFTLIPCRLSAYHGLVAQ